MRVRARARARARARVRARARARVRARVSCRSPYHAANCKPRWRVRMKPCRSSSLRAAPD